MTELAEIDSGGDSGVANGAPGFVTILLNWTGALLSVALVVGLGIWAYQLAVRDASGVPVVIWFCIAPVTWTRCRKSCRPAAP